MTHKPSTSKSVSATDHPADTGLDGAAAGRPDSGAISRVPLFALCVTEITSWGILYYAFPVLASAISRDTGWSTGTDKPARLLSYHRRGGRGR